MIRDGSLEFFDGHGVADIASDTPITEDTVFRIASITKTFTAVAVMQLWERGLVDLDAPANDYLRAYRLIPAKPGLRPATVRHLLTHTAGLPEVAHPWGALMPDFGEGVKAGRPLPSLAEFYRGGLRVHAEPGTRFVYGNHGFATLGQLVEDVSGTPLDRYFRERIFEPLGMADTDLLRSERIGSRLATGYRLGSDGEEDPYVFRVDLSEFGSGTTRVVFGQDAGGRMTRLHLELMPLTLDKRPAALNPRSWATGTLGALAGAAAVGAVARRHHG